MARHVLILSTREDFHAVAIQTSLSSLGATGIIVDLFEYPQRMHLTHAPRLSGNSWALAWGDESIDAEDVAGIWYRRPTQPSLPSLNYSEELRELAQAQVTHAIQGWLESADNVINRPAAERCAARKPWQLHCAQEVGLRIPDTRITNDADSVRDFWEQRKGEVVFKGLASHHSFFHETRRLLRGDMDQLDSLAAGPAIFQQYIPLGRDLRITLVDGTAVASEIVADRELAATDWRVDMHADYRRTTIDRGLEDLLMRLVSRLGLRYAAVDVREDKNGIPYFLEANPSGQFVFNDIHAGTDICELLARSLLGNRVGR